MQTWYCAVLALRCRRDGDTDHIDSSLWPFGVCAENYHEALGKATVVKDAVARKHPGWARYDVIVNSLAEAGLVTDPANIKFS